MEHSQLKIKKVNNYMAILRNLRNINKAEVSDQHIRKVCSALIHPPAIQNSKQLPFRFYSAYSVLKAEIADQRLLDAVEQAMEISVANLPRFKGKVAALCDNSGSAHGTFTSSAGTMRVSTIANLTAVLTCMVTDGEASVYPFGDKLEEVKIDVRQGIFAQTDRVEKIARTVGGGTETGVWLFWDKAITNKEHFDHVFVYSDMQAGYGQLFCESAHQPTPEFKWKNNGARHHHSHIDVPALISAYRKKVNPNIQVYLVQVAGYSDTIIPEIYDKTYILGGWSSGILNFAHKVSSMNPGE